MKVINHMLRLQEQNFDLHLYDTNEFQANIIKHAMNINQARDIYWMNEIIIMGLKFSVACSNSQYWKINIKCICEGWHIRLV